MIWLLNDVSVKPEPLWLEPDGVRNAAGTSDGAPETVVPSDRDWETNSLMLVADTALRREITDFARLDPDGEAAGTSIRDVNYDGNSTQIKLSVDLYQSDHGIVSIVNMNPDCSPDTSNKDVGYLINPEYFGISELIPMGSTRLPNLGGGERGYVDCALTSLVYHPGAHGKITALS